MRVFDCDTLFGPLPEAEPGTSLDTLVSTMGKHGVEKALTASTFGIFHEHGVGNEKTLAGCKERPELLPMATINPNASIEPAAEVKGFGERGFMALRLYNGLQEWPLAFAPLREILKAAGKYALPVIVDSDRPGLPTALLDAMPPDTPSLRVVMGGVRYFNSAEAFAAMRADGRLLLSVKNIIMPDSIELAVQTVGAGRLVMASTAPADYMLPGILRVENAHISDADKEAILWGNAEALISG